MDRIDKALARLSKRERSWVKTILEKISAGDLTSLDVKRLKGTSDVFRVRMGDIRIIFRQVNDKIFLLMIERRGEGTYRNL